MNIKSINIWTKQLPRLSWFNLEFLLRTARHEMTCILKMTVVQEQYGIESLNSQSTPFNIFYHVDLIQYHLVMQFLLSLLWSKLDWSWGLKEFNRLVPNTEQITQFALHTVQFYFHQLTRIIRASRGGHLRYSKGLTYLTLCLEANSLVLINSNWSHLTSCPRVVRIIWGRTD